MVPPESWLHVHFAQYDWPDAVPVCLTHVERLSSMRLICSVVVEEMGALPVEHFEPASYVNVCRGAPPGAFHGAPHLYEPSHAEQSQSWGVLHVARVCVQPVPILMQRRRSQQNCMVVSLMQSPHTLIGSGVGGGVGGGVGAGGGVGTGPGPPHAPESSQSEHRQSTSILHVARGLLQPSPGFRQ